MSARDRARIGGADKRIGFDQRLGALVTDQSATDNRDPQWRSRHAYSLDCAPTNSKSNGSSVASRCRHRLARIGRALRVQQQEPATAGPTSFPPTTPLRRASMYRSSIRPLAIPGERRRLLSQCSCISSAYANKSPATSRSRLRSPSPWFGKVLQHLWVPLPGARVLICEDDRRVPRITRVEQQHVVTQGAQRLRLEFERFTVTLRRCANVYAQIPPCAATYGSCLPHGSLRTSISISHAASPAPPE